MGKKSATKRSSNPTEAVTTEKSASAGTEAQKLLETGNKHFARKEHLKALEAYDKGLRASESHGERPLLHSNKAACYMMLQRYKEAIKECSNALDEDPVYVRALTRRAKAYEAMGHYKQALTDIQKANKADSANPDTQEAEKRLKDLVAGKSKANGVLSNGVKKGTTKRNPQNMIVHTVKISLDGEVRMIHILGSSTYAELLEQAMLKFPGAPPCALKYLDREGDLVTLTDKNDVNKALEECVQTAEKLAGGSRATNFNQFLPPLRIQLVPVGEGNVPEPPVEEKRHLEQLNQARKLIQQHAANQLAKKEETEQQQQEPYDIEPWLVEFANLFRDQLGIEPDRHLDLTNVAWEKLQAAMETAVLDDKAPGLFDQAVNRFQEVTAHGLLQWGNVYLCKGKRILDRAAVEGKSLEDVAKEAEAEFSKAEAKFKEVTTTKADMYDGLASLASLAFERGKLAAGFTVPPAKPNEPEKEDDIPEKPSKDGKALSNEESEAESKAKQEASMAASRENLVKCLSKLSKDSLAKGKDQFDLAWSKFQEVLDLLPEEEKNKPLKPLPAEQEQQTAQEEDANIWAHLLVMWGNLQYEYSQMLAAVESEWKPTLDSAVEKFRTAGCPEADIRGAMKNHTMKDEIDLGPEPEPEKKEPEPVKEVEKSESAEDVKGLPTLKPRSKKKAGEE